MFIQFTNHTTTQPELFNILHIAKVKAYAGRTELTLAAGSITDVLESYDQVKLAILKATENSPI